MHPTAVSPGGRRTTTILRRSRVTATLTLALLVVLLAAVHPALAAFNLFGRRQEVKDIHTHKPESPFLEKSAKVGHQTVEKVKDVGYEARNAFLMAKDRSAKAKVTIEEGAEELKEGAKRRWDYAKESAEEIAEASQHGWKKAKAKASDLSEDAQERWEAAKDTAEDYLEDVKEGWETVKDKAEDITDAAREKLGAAKETAENVAENVKDTAERGWDKAKDTAEDISDGLRHRWEQAKDKAEDIKDSAGQGLRKAKGKAEDVADNVKDKAEDVVDSVKDKAEGVKDSAKRGWNRAKGKVEDAAEDVKDSAERGWGKTVTKAKDVADDVSEAVDDAQESWDETKEEALGAWESAVHQARRAWREATGNLEDAKGKGKDKWNDIKDEAKDKWNDIKDEAESKWVDSRKHLREKWDETTDKLQDSQGDLPEDDVHNMDVRRHLRPKWDASTKASIETLDDIAAKSFDSRRHLRGSWNNDNLQTDSDDSKIEWNLPKEWKDTRKHLRHNWDKVTREYEKATGQRQGWLSWIGSKLGLGDKDSAIRRAGSTASESIQGAASSFAEKARKATEDLTADEVSFGPEGKGWFNLDNASTVEWLNWVLLLSSGVLATLAVAATAYYNGWLQSPWTSEYSGRVLRVNAVPVRGATATRITSRKTRRTSRDLGEELEDEGTQVTETYEAEEAVVAPPIHPSPRATKHNLRSKDFTYAEAVGNDVEDIDSALEHQQEKFAKGHYTPTRARHVDAGGREVRGH
ncbi:hypothetical protein, variant [Capsaspora owczarzaki ATCC 30864]|uniref:Uncharacterized protein n=1 Tax=Capsaspora owczarzaki (strain ATCC 30864) TaxID=595528 RepID=A0A0D2VZL6_CAPO3|nr:hypothetical protein, variant [Capsaspora owczarzaki ATCC 30864]